MRHAGETDCKYTGQGVYELERHQQRSRPRWDPAQRPEEWMWLRAEVSRLASKEA